MIIADGKESDGIRFHCELKGGHWVVDVRHPDGRSRIEQFRCSFEPRFGPDVDDVRQAEEIMDKLIGELRCSS